MRWRDRSGLRARLMMAVVAVTAFGLALCGVGLYVALDVTLNQRIDADARASAAAVATLVETGRLPAVLPVSGDQLIQVLDGQGRVMAASPGADRLVAMLTAAEVREVARDGPVRRPGRAVGIAQPVRVLVRPVADAAVVVAVPIDDLLATRRALRAVLASVLPLLLALLAATAWWMIRRTLRPVEELRAGADRIRTGGADDDRLPVPGPADEVRALAETLNAMLDRLAEERLRQRMFVADAAHELRTPLTTLRTGLEVAGLTGTVPAEVVADLLIDVDRLIALVEDLLLLARSEGEAALHLAEEVDVAGLVADVVRGYQDREVAVVADPTVDGEVRVRIQPTHLRRVLTNLVDNGVRHARTEVRLAVRQDAEEVVVTVTDDGPGIAVADRERVFERFLRLDDSRHRDAGGSGLGLAIVRDLVTRAGGRVRFSTDPGLSQAEVRLPAARTRPRSIG